MPGTCEVCGKDRDDLVRCRPCRRRMCPEHITGVIRREDRDVAVCKPCELDREYDDALIHGARSISDALIEAVESNRYLDHLESLDPMGFVS